MTPKRSANISASANPIKRAKTLKTANGYGVRVASAAVCTGHSSPLDYLTEWIYDRPSLSLVHGPRGGGKSYLAALATHIESQVYRWHGTKILGGSLAQSRQIYNAIREFDRKRPGFVNLMKEQATYTTGSEVSILAASSSSVRGPHVPTLRLDEVDEIDDDIRDAAAGMCMQTGNERASVSMTSTWHKVAGPMQGLKDAAADPALRIRSHTFCVFEILEKCPETRSGPHLEHCPSCPIVSWCHDGSPTPKAKRSNGHYSIDALIQKTALVSPRAFESDYLSMGPRAAGLWFKDFEECRHAGDDEKAEYDPHLPVHLSVDNGVFTGAIFYQVRHDAMGAPVVTIFGDYLAENVTAEMNARELLRLADSLCRGQLDYRITDPAGGARNPVGATVMAEYKRAGLPMVGWPVRGISDGLAAVESAVKAADGLQRLWIHSRCRNTIKAFQNYRRAKRRGQWQDYPEDPQHPFEDLLDAVRGAFVAEQRGRGSWGADPLA